MAHGQSMSKRQANRYANEQRAQGIAASNQGMVQAPEMPIGDTQPREHKMKLSTLLGAVTSQGGFMDGLKTAVAGTAKDSDAYQTYSAIKKQVGKGGGK